MLPSLRVIVSSRAPARRAHVARALLEARVGVEVTGEGPSERAVTVTSKDWAADDFDLLALDDRIWRTFASHGACDVCVDDDEASEPAHLAALAMQVALRFQRFESSGNDASSTPLFRSVLAAHERLHDRARPLVAADHDHALDTWRWLLRLDPSAGLAAQLAALFHDVERLVTEAEARIEQRAPDYAAFKRAHAATGARLAAEILANADVPAAVIDETSALVAAHEDAPGGSEAATLANADALSFFSLNAPGFMQHYGPEHFARKCAYTARRLDDSGRAWLPRLKLTGAARSLAASAAP